MLLLSVDTTPMTVQTSRNHHHGARFSLSSFLVFLKTYPKGHENGLGAIVAFVAVNATVLESISMSQGHRWVPLIANALVLGLVSTLESQMPKSGVHSCCLRGATHCRSRPTPPWSSFR
ncbi:hypothetical protein V6N13_113117 [Hibiscus sabdariffa]